MSVSEIKIFHGTDSMSELMSEPMFMSVCERSSELGIHGPKPVDLGSKRTNLEIQNRTGMDQNRQNSIVFQKQLFTADFYR